MFTNHVYLIYMYKQDLALDNLQGLISSKTQPANQPTNQPNFYTLSYMIHKNLGCPGGVMVKAMGCRIVVREFVPQSRYYVHFRANTPGKGMNPLILPVMS